MLKQLSAFIKPFIKPLLAATLAIVLVFGQAQSALAASGGRIGGGSFRTPSPSFSSPGRSYSSPGGGYGGGGYYPGGGFGYGYPFLIPSIGIGGFGSLFTVLIFLSIAGFLVRTLRSARSSDSDYGYDGASSTVSLAKLQVGLLSEARSLQADLNRIAEAADTSSTAGLSQVLQETTLALLRHPEYWAYANSQIQQTNLLSAENQFNRLALTERSKFSAETLSNVDNLLKQAEARQALAAGGELATLEREPGEYIVVTMLVATEGKLQLPAINDTQDLRQAISQIGSVSSERLMALEVLWTPQAEGDTLSADDVIAQYPELKLV